jgi:hypothetical protein
MIRFGLIAAAVISAGALSFAQFGAETRYDAGAVSALVDRVHADLNHAYGAFHFSGGDRDRLNHAEKQLREFAKKWAKGNFEKDELNDAIESVQHVLDENKLPPEDRDAISDDVARLRRMREAYDHHEIEGAHH